jgi:hypothetical protein
MNNNFLSRLFILKIKRTNDIDHLKMDIILILSANYFVCFVFIKNLYMMVGVKTELSVFGVKTVAIL